MSTALCEKMVAKYGSRDEMLQLFNPSVQMQICSSPDACYFGDFPTLSQLTAYGSNTPAIWLIPQLVNLSEYCGAKDKLNIRQLEELASVIATEFYFLKVSEIMLFLHRFKSGKYGRMYGTVDPMIITTSLREFVKERANAYDRRDIEEKQKAREKAAAEAVTWEEYRAKHQVTNPINPFERCEHTE